MFNPMELSAKTQRKLELRTEIFKLKQELAEDYNVFDEITLEKYEEELKELMMEEKFFMLP